jgi:hypothetical protein
MHGVFFRVIARIGPRQCRIRRVTQRQVFRAVEIGGRQMLCTPDSPAGAGTSAGLQFNACSRGVARRWPADHAEHISMRAAVPSVRGNPPSWIGEPRQNRADQPPRRVRHVVEPHIHRHPLSAGEGKDQVGMERGIDREEPAENQQARDQNAGQDGAGPPDTPTARASSMGHHCKRRSPAARRRSAPPRAASRRSEAGAAAPEPRRRG